MDSNLQKYHAFAAAVEQGSFTKAAQVLNYTQSGVSRMISDLEREWGLVLLERGKSGVRLTGDGRKLLPLVKNICGEHEKLLSRVNEMKGLKSGLIRIGSFSSAAAHWLPNIIREFQKDYPDIEYELLLGDYDEIERLAKEIRPLILLAGYSAYPRKIDFKRMSEIAHSVGAVFMVDMAHFAGLVAGGVFKGDYDPVKWADIVTTTTHKTLRGPRGGMILCKKEFAESVDKGCPLVIGGPLPHVLAAKAVAFTEALKPEFRNYAERIVANARALAGYLMEDGVSVLTGGTDNHLMLIDVTPFNLNGRMAESLMRDAGITLNRNALPFDPNGPWYTSGLRIGTPAVTTLGMKDEDMKEIADIIALVLKNAQPLILTKGENAGKPSKNKAKVDKEILSDARKRVKHLLEKHLLYPELDLPFLEKEFLIEE